MTTGVQPLLVVRGLDISYAGTTRAVKQVDLDVRPGEVIGLVGESGSGKSTLCMGILHSLPQSATLTADRLELDNTDLRNATKADWRAIHWRKLSYIPQGAMNALNPVRRIGHQFLDIVRDHEGPSTLKAQRARLTALAESMHLPATVLDRYPHELSGGMKQRVCIMMAIIFGPKLVVADEPTSALDVISQQVVLGTLLEARHKVGSAVLLVGHDLALQAQVADRICIMNDGRIVEIGPTRVIFENPVHPYTRELLKAVPSVRVKQDLDTFLRMADSTERPVYPSGPVVEVEPAHFVMMAGTAA